MSESVPDSGTRDRHESHHRQTEIDEDSDIALFERLADRYADHEAGRAFELAAQSLREER
ncbi:hypothetical protein [Halobellus ruber]|uniref:Uncharacterized protein n=1 Tax=Halobellus ruber TaxID=2761102 RepID=A0A7J9SF75_9EURY|nr:hypothetical protein [Halobellus ruber]MBB6645033.1 hypothetical protein [Halobellus ruber]